MSHSLLDRCTAAAKNQESLKHQSGELQTSQWCKRPDKSTDTTEYTAKNA